MADEKKSYERALDITEKALDAYVEGDKAKGGKLVDQAKAVDEGAVRDVYEELEEDASKEHDPKKLSGAKAGRRPA